MKSFRQQCGDIESTSFINIFPPCPTDTPLLEVCTSTSQAKLDLQYSPLFFLFPAPGIFGNVSTSSPLRWQVYIRFVVCCLWWVSHFANMAHSISPTSQCTSLARYLSTALRKSFFRFVMTHIARLTDRPKTNSRACELPCPGTNSILCSILRSIAPRSHAHNLRRNFFCCGNAQCTWCFPSHEPQRQEAIGTRPRKHTDEGRFDLADPCYYCFFGACWTLSPQMLESEHQEQEGASAASDVVR
jgi:hypothetical protein